MKVWYQAINSELKFPNKQLDDLRRRCKEEATEHLNRLNLSEADHQNIVYS